MTELRNIQTDVTVPVVGVVKNPENGENYPMTGWCQDTVDIIV